MTDVHTPRESASGEAEATRPFGENETEPDVSGSGATAGWPRWAWRQLTSMRTALVLLFLLALGSVPGSVLPQQGSDPASRSVRGTTHPTSDVNSSR